MHVAEFIYYLKQVLMYTKLNLGAFIDIYLHLYTTLVHLRSRTSYTVRKSFYFDFIEFLTYAYITGKPAFITRIVGVTLALLIL